MKRAIIVGASSGIGEELARQMAADGWELGLLARRTELLDKLATQLPTDARVRALDVSQPEEAATVLTTLLEEMHPVSVVVLNAGVGLGNFKLKLDRELQTVAVNVTGFVATLNAAYHYFEGNPGGQIVGISSVASHRGGYGGPAYSASKAFISNYMEGVRVQAHKRKLELAVTDVRPGYVKTPLLDQMKGVFWVVPVDKAVRQIYQGIVRRRRVFYVTRRWAWVAAAYRLLPEAVLRMM